MLWKVQLLMLNRGMNKGELAKAIGVSTGNMSDWANGRSSPNVKTVIKIADFFGVSTDYLLGRDDRYPVPSEDACALLNIFNKLDKDGKTIVLANAYQQKQRMLDNGLWNDGDADT